jgi:hypothetical protein
MLNFFLAGGFPMWFTLIFGVLAMVAAGSFVRRGRPKSLAVVRALTAATAFIAIAGTSADFTAAMWKIARRFGDEPKVYLIVMQGLGEAATPITLGFALLSMAWLLVAVGVRRHEDPPTR